MKRYLFMILTFMILIPIMAIAQEVAPAINEPVSFEWLGTLLAPLILKFKWVGIVLMVLGTLVVSGQIIVVITPTKKDDAFMAKVKEIPILGGLLIFIERFAIFEKK